MKTLTEDEIKNIIAGKDIHAVDMRAGANWAIEWMIKNNPAIDRGQLIKIIEKAADEKGVLLRTSTAEIFADAIINHLSNSK